MCHELRCLGIIVFCKYKTSYEMRIRDWSSDVFSSDLRRPEPGPRPALPAHVHQQRLAERCDGAPEERLAAALRAVEQEATVVVSDVLGAVQGQPGDRVAHLSPVVRGTVS